MQSWPATRVTASPAWRYRQHMITEFATWAEYDANNASIISQSCFQFLHLGPHIYLHLQCLLKISFSITASAKLAQTVISVVINSKLSDYIYIFTPEVLCSI